MTPIIQAANLRKVFKTPVKKPGVWGSISGLVSRETTEKVAVEGLDLTIEKGEVVGFLGPNGAGKTTTIKMLCGILYPSAGEAKVLGHDPWKRNVDMLRKIALVMGNKQQLWWDLSASESFRTLKEIYEVPTDKFKSRLDELVEALSLDGIIDRQVRKMSLGERMKCELVAALLHAPQVVFLDEPTIGLDVISQQRIRQFLKSFNTDTGSTILLTSHYMQDVEELCERVVIINHGQKMYDGTLTALRARYSDTKLLRLTLSEPVAELNLPKGAKLMSQEGQEILLSIERSEVPTATAALLSSLPVQDLSLEDTDVEEVISQAFSSSEQPSPVK